MDEAVFQIAREASHAMAGVYERGWKDGCRDAIQECKRLGLITGDGVTRAQVLLDRLEADGA